MQFMKTSLVIAAIGALLCCYGSMPVGAQSESGGVFYGAGSESEGVGLGSTESGTPLKEWGEVPGWGASSQAPSPAAQWGKGNESAPEGWGAGNESGFPDQQTMGPESESGGVVYWGSGNLSE
jgi:hypothetical protein